MNAGIERTQQKLAELAENAMTATAGDADALHNILIDLIDSVANLAYQTGEALEAKPAYSFCPKCDKA